MSSPSNHSIEQPDAQTASGQDDGAKKASSDSNERTDDWTDLARPDSKKDSHAENPDDDSAKPDDAASTDVIRDNDHSHSLRSKLVLTLAFMLALVVGIDELVRQKVIAPEFAALERDGAIKDTDRVESAIETEIEFLAELASVGAAQLQRPNYSDPEVDNYFAVLGNRHRAAWTAILETAILETATLEKATLGTAILETATLGTATDETDRHWQRLDSTDDAETTNSLPLSQLGKHLLPERFVQADEVHGMVLDHQGQPHLYAAVPIEHPQRSLPAEAKDQKNEPFDETHRIKPTRLFVVGKRFDQSMVSELKRRTRVDFELDLNVQDLTPADVDPSYQDDDATHGLTIHVINQSQLVTRRHILGVHGRPIANLVIHIPRDVTSRSKQATAFARSLSLSGISISLVLLLFLLQYIVVGRLKSIREQTERIARTGFGSDDTADSDLIVFGDDEIGQLARSFDRMRSRLSDAQRRLSDASHAAGMSFVADTVIHNVGNVLTNVNSLIETASERVQHLRIEPLEKLADRLRDPHTDDDLYRETPDYLQRLSQTLEDDKDELAELLKTLNENVQHIHQVIRDQSRHTRKRLELSNTTVGSMVGEAVRCCRARLQQDHVRVHFDNTSDAQIRTDRSLLLQILINLISNAGNAMRGVRGRQPELRIDLIRTVSTIHLRFRDNGCGMDAATQARIFDAHFTTRQTGSGLGLHFCAIAIKRIGGSIHAESDGPETGATFILELPLNAHQTASADPQQEPATTNV